MLHKFAFITGLLFVQLSLAQNTVTADFETDAVIHEDDAADDTFTIMIEGKNPMIMATDKKGGLVLYDHEGKTLKSYWIGKTNNIDGINQQNSTLFAVTNVTQKSVQLFTLDEQLNLILKLEIPGLVGNSKVYGIALGKTQQLNHLRVAYSVKKAGVFVHDVFINKAGVYSHKSFMQFLETTTVEGMVFDKFSHMLYFAEESKGIWQWSIKSDALPVVVVNTGTPYLFPDVEGLTIYAKGSKSYLLASSQGNNSYAIFNLTSRLEYITSFMIGEGHFDGTSITDGIEAVSTAWGTRFPEGVFIAQDNDNLSPDMNAENQNFKIVDWRKIKALLPETQTP